MRPSLGDKQIERAHGSDINISAQMVCKWRKRYLWQGLAGLHDELRPGRPRTISDQEEAMLVRMTIDTKPQNRTHWTIRTAARDTQLLRPAAHRIWQAFGCIMVEPGVDMVQHY